MILESSSHFTIMSESESEPKPDIMDGCGVSFWMIAGLFLLLVIPLGIRTCSDSSEDAEVDELERNQRVRKILDAKDDERALREQLTISLEEAMQRALTNADENIPSESKAIEVDTTGEKDNNATGEENLK